MNALFVFVRAIDRLNEWVGRAVSWLTLATVIVCFAVATLRYGFSTGTVWSQELYVWFHAIVFMVGAGYTLKHGGHVRVDIFYAGASLRRRAWIDLVGTVLFLLPWLAVIAYFSWPFIANSWRGLEISSQPGGMPAVFVLKSVILLFVGVVGLQGLALAARSILVLSGREDAAPVGPGH